MKDGPESSHVESTSRPRLGWLDSIMVVNSETGYSVSSHQLDRKPSHPSASNTLEAATKNAPHEGELRLVDEQLEVLPDSRLDPQVLVEGQIIELRPKLQD